MPKISVGIMKIIDEKKTQKNKTKKINKDTKEQVGQKL